MDDSLNAAKARIRAALESGIRMTTAQGNRIGKTVDFRKIVSLLKSEGFDIQSYWNEKDRRRWKTYYHQHPLPQKGTRMNELGQSKLQL